MRNEIIALLARLQQSSSEDEQDNSNLREITCDRIFSLFNQFLPEPEDIDAKYELNGGPISMTIDTINNSERQNLDQVSHIARFANDEGWNRYHATIKRKLQELYEV